jgi:RNA polymerase sigma-70 factor (ECF subfamily)
LHAPEPDLKALMLAGLEGDAAAYRTLLEAVRVRLVVFFQRRLGRQGAEIEDLVQETLIAVHTHRGTYDRSQLFTAWAYAIARHKLVDHFRRAGRRPTVPLEEAGNLFQGDAGDGIAARYDIEKALQNLPPQTQALIRDIKLREWSNAEAASQHGMSETAVKVAVHRGLKKMSAFLRSGDDN